MEAIFIDDVYPVYETLCTNCLCRIKTVEAHGLIRNSPTLSCNGLGTIVPAKGTYLRHL